MNERINQSLNSLKKSSFRSKFALTGKDRQYIENKGIEIIRKHACDFINLRIAPPVPKNDGKQTPMKGHPVFIAQHATATCCRGCIQKWHGIEKDSALNEKEVQYIVALIMGWIERQINEKRGSAV
jgi:exodeoxyribonuclease V alpha subunit